MVAMELLRAGCRWRMGTDHSISIWKDPWFPCTPSFGDITPKPSNCPMLNVSDLMLEDILEYNIGVISSLFWPEERDLILQIPLSLGVVSNLLVWHCSSNGIFSIRRAYHLALSLDSPAGSSDGHWDTRLWRVVCRAYIRNKVKVWAVSRLHWYDIDAHVLSMEQWFYGLNLKLAQKDFILPLQVVDFAHNYLLAFLCRSPKVLNTKSVHQSSWHLPRRFRLKLILMEAFLMEVGHWVLVSLLVMLWIRQRSHRRHLRQGKPFALPGGINGIKWFLRAIAKTLLCSSKLLCI
ncbi:UNVERIFIED_CONTAM: hypothetical protein Sradi_5253700 [Sesamum radiatum]|uniref:Reverse transcriptase zinc-binding domain-containing protein n=1 Tax=Sesamum radiatum TaxID=300843 RepID=A0AAW2LL02_SESRA